MYIIKYSDGDERRNQYYYHNLERRKCARPARVLAKLAAGAHTAKNRDHGATPHATHRVEKVQKSSHSITQSASITTSHVRTHAAFIMQSLLTTRHQRIYRLSKGSKGPKNVSCFAPQFAPTRIRLLSM